MKIFKDRQSAGQLLAKRLKNIHADLVLGIPRGGVVVAAEVAKILKLPLDIIVTRKIGAPMQPELALGAVDPDGECIWEGNLLKDLRLKINDLGEIIQNEWKELKRREDLYRGEKPPLKPEGKIVILVDDGIATGATTLAAINFLKRHKAKEIILAVPVASKESAERLTEQIDEAMILETPDYFQAVGQFYQSFLPVSDEEVVQFLS
ncbi:MAG: phosphoribosyltransferase [Microgenomates group bacterium Gr01-1014_7]|nr:MAG: phosphoribosyltransferase [Microgenomates group bacterium Gr01-1014_7]